MYGVHVPKLKIQFFAYQLILIIIICEEYFYEQMVVFLICCIDVRCVHEVALAESCPKPPIEENFPTVLAFCQAIDSPAEVLSHYALLPKGSIILPLTLLPKTPKAYSKH